MKEGFSKKCVVLHGIVDSSEVNKNLFHNILEKVKDIGISENQIDDIKRIGFNVGNRPVVIKLQANCEDTAIRLIAVSSRHEFFDNHVKLKDTHGITH